MSLSSVLGWLANAIGMISSMISAVRRLLSGDRDAVAAMTTSFSGEQNMMLPPSPMAA